MKNLDLIREELQEWLAGLYTEENGLGSFRMGAEGEPNLLSATDAAWLMYAMGTVDRFPEDKKRAWVAWLKAQQNEQDGSYAYTSAVGPKNMHSNGHAFWHTSRALGILGSEINVFPEYLRPLITTDGLDKWFRAWREQENNTHHDVLGLIPMLANTNDQAWIDLFYDNLTADQDSETGTWLTPAKKTNISRTFAYNCIYAAAGKIPDHAEIMVDTIFSLQAADGLWHDSNHSYFSSMDSIYILSHVPQKIGYKTAEANDALTKAAKRMSEVFDEEKEYFRGNTHAMLSIVHAFGLLRDAVPEMFAPSAPWHFDWDNTKLFKSSIFSSVLTK